MDGAFPLSRWTRSIEWIKRLLQGNGGSGGGFILDGLKEEHFCCVVEWVCRVSRLEYVVSDLRCGVFFERELVTGGEKSGRSG